MKMERKLNDRLKDFGLPFIAIPPIAEAVNALSKWATMCKNCYRKHGIGIGNGVGQKYINNKHGKFQKVSG